MITVAVFALTFFALTIVLMSLWGVVSPGGLIDIVRSTMRRRGALAFAVGIRLVLAVLLWVAAPVSHTPAVFRALAILVLVAALAIALMGSGRARRLIDYIAAWPGIALRVMCLVGIAFGLFLAWSVMPGWRGL